MNVECHADCNVSTKRTAVEEYVVRLKSTLNECLMSWECMLCRSAIHFLIFNISHVRHIVMLFWHSEFVSCVRSCACVCARPLFGEELHACLYVCIPGNKDISEGIMLVAKRMLFQWKLVTGLRGAGPNCTGVKQPGSWPNMDVRIEKWELAMTIALVDG